ncbi:cag pathogenicity island protein Cag5 (plasmid) [Serratia marcescens]|nr:cag pathogenicity island protein Cag5 [Serratia marcescens]
MTKPKFIITFLVFTLTPCISLATPIAKNCASIDNAEIEGLFEKWNNTLKTGDARKVNNNYLSNAVLLPTLSNKVRLTDAERIDYFNNFLKKGPEGKIDSRTILSGCNHAIDSGNYTFIFSDNSMVYARYTFTYAWDGRDWKISSHHSSIMPEN